MSKAVLDPKGYGRKIYNRFPKVYKREDENYKYTLQRYLDVVGDGTEPFIEEANGLLDFYDPIKCPSRVLPYVFSSFGLEIFHGIPDLYVRNILPMIGQLYKRKGTFDVVEYLTEIITDSKVTVEVVRYDNVRAYFGEALFGSAVLGDGSGVMIGIIITIEVDYGNSREILPDHGQIERIVKEFVPFYCLVLVRFAFVYDDKAKLDVRENWHDYMYHLTDENPYLEVTESGFVNLIRLDYKEDIIYPNIRHPRSTAVIGKGTLGYMLFSGHADDVENASNARLGENELGYMVFGHQTRLKGNRSALIGRARIGDMMLGHRAVEWNTITDATFGRAVIGDSVMGEDYSKWMKYVIKAPFQVDDTDFDLFEKRLEQFLLDLRDMHKDEAKDFFDTTYGYFGIGRFGEMVFGKHLYGKSGYLNIGLLGKLIFGEHKYGKSGYFGLGRLGESVFDEFNVRTEKSGSGDNANFFANDVKSDIVGHYAEEEADGIIATGYLPPRSAVFKGGQPLGKSVIGVNQPYTSVDYTVDEIIYSDGSVVEVIVD